MPQFVFTYTGANQTFVVPSGVPHIAIKAWGAGGGGGMTGSGGFGGPGGYTFGRLTVTPGETLTIIVGQGGVKGGQPTSIQPTYGGGGAGGFDQYSTDWHGASGGGRSAVRRSTSDVLTAGGGGGAAGMTDQNKFYTDIKSWSNGGSGGGLTGIDAYNQGCIDQFDLSKGGKGGTQVAGGTGGTGDAETSGLPGSLYQGGTGGVSGAARSGAGGGGGGGYYGGGGGAGEKNPAAFCKIQSTQDAAAGGGSSYIGGVTSGVTLFTPQITSTDPLTVNLAPPNTGDFDYIAGVGQGGNSDTNGGNGLVVLYYNIATITGKVFNDLNSNGVYDPGEPGIPNAYVVLYGPAPTVFCVETLTDANGNYALGADTAGTYTVYETAILPNACPPTILGQPPGFLNSTTFRTQVIAITQTQIDNDVTITGNNYGHDNAPLFPCNATAYQTVAISAGPPAGPMRFEAINLQTGATTPIVPNTGLYIDAIGYSIMNGMIYGIVTSTMQLVRFASNGAVTVMGTLQSIPGVVFRSGAVDDDGHLYLVPTPPASVYYVLDVNDNSPTLGQYLNPLTGFTPAVSPYSTPLSSTIDITDWCYGHVDGQLYSAENGTGRVLRINPLTGVVTPLTTTGIPSTTYSSQFMEDMGKLFALEDSTGNIYLIDISGGTATGSLLSSSSPTNGNSDGAVCHRFSSFLDFGDAPDTNPGTGPGNYNTRLENNGPRHKLLPNLTLGTQITVELNALQNANATGDDIAAGIQDDGVTTPLPNWRTDIPTYPLSVRVFNNTGSPANLYGWVDMNRDGVFENYEAAPVVVVPSSGTLSTVTLNFADTPFVIMTGGDTFARIRLTTDNLVHTGSITDQDTRSIGYANDGEVEDYIMYIQGASIIAGLVFNDLNNNGSYDPGDPGIPSSYVVLYSAQTGCQAIQTDLNGNFSFGVTTATTYTVYETAINPGVDCPPTSFGQPTGFNSSTTLRTQQVVVTQNDVDNNNSFLGGDFGHSNIAGFECAPIAYQTKYNGGPSTGNMKLSTLNLATGQTTDIIANTGTVLDAIGYSVLDNMIYCIDTTNFKLIRFSAGGIQTTIGSLQPLQGVTMRSGTVDNAGHLYLAPNPPASVYYVLDVNQNSATFGQFVNPLAGFVAAIPPYSVPFNPPVPLDISDWTYNPVDGQLYAVKNQTSTVVKINPTSGIVQNLITTGIPSSTYSSQFMDATGTLFAEDDATGDIYRAILSGSPTSNADALLLSQSTPSFLDSDGTMCHNAYFGLDFGDAPDVLPSNSTGDYSTMLQHNGPRHQIINNLRLGTQITAEANAYQNSSATGDDIGLGIQDDGVLLPIAPILIFNPIYTVQVSALNPLNNNANLYAWIDFNRNGVFEATEAAPVTVVSSNVSPVSYSIPFTLPANVVIGTSFLRLRLTTDNLVDTQPPSGLDTRSLGPASDGEVEDYEVQITGNDVINVIALKSATPSVVKIGDTITYTIQILNSSTYTINNVTVFDAPPPGTVFLKNSVFIDGVKKPGADPSTGILVGDMDVNQVSLVKFSVKYTDPTCCYAIGNVASINFSYVDRITQNTIHLQIKTNMVYTSKQSQNVTII